MACYICASLYLRACFSWHKTDNIYRPRCMLLIAYWDGFQNALGVSSTELCNYFPIVSLGATISSTVWVTTASAPSSASVSPLLLFPLTPRVCVCVSPTSDRFPTCRSGRESSHQPLCSGHLPPQLTHITSLHSPYDYTRLAVSLLDEELCVEDLTLSLFFVREDNTQAKKKKKKDTQGSSNDAVRWSALPLRLFYVTQTPHVRLSGWNWCLVVSRLFRLLFASPHFW